MRLQYPSGHTYDVPDDADQATIDQVTAYDKQTYSVATKPKPSIDDALAAMAQTYKYPGKKEIARRAANRSAATTANKKSAAYGQMMNQTGANLGVRDVVNPLGEVAQAGGESLGSAIGGETGKAIGGFVGRGLSYMTPGVGQASFGAEITNDIASAPDLATALERAGTQGLMLGAGAGVVKLGGMALKGLSNAIKGQNAVAFEKALQQAERSGINRQAVYTALDRMPKTPEEARFIQGVTETPSGIASAVKSKKPVPPATPPPTPVAAGKEAWEMTKREHMDQKVPLHESTFDWDGFQKAKEGFYDEGRKLIASGDLKVLSEGKYLGTRVSAKTKAGTDFLDRWHEALKPWGGQRADLKEFINEMASTKPTLRAIDEARDSHARAVESALKEGKPVPPEVLADYPDLASKYQKQPKTAISEPPIGASAPPKEPVAPVGEAPVTEVPKPPQFTGDVNAPYAGAKPPTVEPPVKPSEPVAGTEPKPAAPKATMPAGPHTEATDGQGITHASVDDLRQELGFPERTPTATKSDNQLMADAAKLSGKETPIAQRLLAEKKRTLADDEAVALGVRLKQLKSEMVDAKAKNDGNAFDLADAEAQTIADALDASGSRQGRDFRARRFLVEDNFDSWTFDRGTAKANLDQPLTGSKAAQQTAHSADLDATTAALKAERDAAVKNYEDLLAATLSKRSKGPMNPAQRRNAALATLKRLGVRVLDDVDPNAAAASVKSKKAGFINIPADSVEQVATAVRSIVRSYADDGLHAWPDVLKRLQKDLPGIEEEQALWILSGKYKQAKLAADMAKKRAYAFMSEVKRDAEFRMKPLAAKVGSYALDILNTTQRSMQTTLDDSLALIQGKNVLMWKPGTWFKAVGSSLKAAVQKDPIAFAQREMAKIENEPLYAEAVQAKLGLSDISGPLNRQEEWFAGRLENHVPGLSHSKAMATVLANKMRWDLFRKLAAQAPKEGRAEYLSDIARQINIVTGKGTGRVAEALGSVQAGLVSYAPRYYLSKWQHNLGVPVWAAKTGAGRVQALKMYGTQLAAYTGAVALAQKFGFTVELDPRSANFGVATAADGSYTVDLMRTQSEPVKFLAQIVYGRTSTTGNYTAPGDYGDYGPGDYIESKLAPGARTIMMGTTGMTYDNQTQKRRVAEPADFWKNYIPLSIREMIQNQDQPGTWPASFFGANIGQAPPPGKSKKPPPPMDAMPPGLNRILTGSK